MSDQATELRRLAGVAQAAGSIGDCPRPRLVTVAGGKGGVGTTTIAVNLAVLLARQGRRTVLADVASPGADTVIFCRIPGRHTVADVLAGRRSVAETLEPGPGGVQVLSGPWGSHEVWHSAAAAQDQLIEQFLHLGQIAELLVVDAGNSPTRIARRLWQASDLVFLVATPELASIMNAYAAVKILASPDDPISIRTVVNMAPSAAVADDVHARLALACRRFLGIGSQPAGYLGHAAQVAEAGRRGRPFVLASPGCPASRQMEQLALAVTDFGQAAIGTRSAAYPGPSRETDHRPLTTVH
jgi:flagellar biosynthesis protein FlhG